MLSSGNGYRIVTLLPTTSAKEPPHVALVNLRRDGASLKRWRGQWGTILAAARGKGLRLHTAGHPPGPHIITGELLAIEFELQDFLRRAWRGEKDALDFVQRSVASQTGGWKFHAGQIELVPEDLWTAICVMFLHDRATDKIGNCKGAKCQSPYFKRNRKSQIYCSDVCQHEALNEQKRRWFQVNRGKSKPVTKL